MRPAAVVAMVDSVYRRGVRRGRGALSRCYDEGTQSGLDGEERGDPRYSREVAKGEKSSRREKGE